MPVCRVLWCAIRFLCLPGRVGRGPAATASPWAWLHEFGELTKEFAEVGWGEVMELNLGQPAGVTVDFVNLWCEVGGEGNRRRTKAW